MNTITHDLVSHCNGVDKEEVVEFTKALLKKTYGVEVKVEVVKVDGEFRLKVNGVHQFGFSDYELECSIEEVEEWFLREMSTTF